MSIEEPARDASVDLNDLYRRFSATGIQSQRLRQQRSRLRAVLAPSQWIELKRAVDIALSGAATLALAPLLVGLRAACGPVVRTTRAGRWCEPFDQLSFSPGPFGIARRLRLQGLPTLINILRGDMSFVGPRAVAPGELSPRQRESRRRYDVRPGLICTWWVRRRANIGYDAEPVADAEYAENHGLATDLGIALRAIPAAFFGEPVEEAPRQVPLFGLPIDNLTLSEAVEQIVARTDRSATSQVAFVNADCVNLSFKDAAYRQSLQRDADLVLADGIGVKLAGDLMRLPIKQNVNGTDLFPRLCEQLADAGKSLYLLGAQPGVADEVAAWARGQYPTLKIAGAQHGYFDPSDEPAVLERIRRSGASVLLVAFGAPRQDRWIAENRHALAGVPVAIGVGGLFDFFSGRKPRAPLWMREMGLEWAFRLGLEPARLWKRYVVGNGIFLMRAAYWRFFPPAQARQDWEAAQ